VTELDPERLLRTLVDHEVEFCVIGAVAAWLQGNPSVTLGLDVMPRRELDNAERLAAHMLMGQARWVGWLIALRDTLVAGFGLKTSSELRDDVATDRIDFFRVYDRRRHEIILGEDDRHLDFRCPFWLKSPLCAADLSPQRS